MSDTLLRHLVAAVATIVVLLAFYSGYVAGSHSWWWFGFGCLVVYGLMYKIVDAGH